MSGLHDAIREALRGARGEIVSAYLFGSHAAGTAHEESDIDVGVLFDRAALGDRRARADRAVRLASDIIAATHCNRVDVVPLEDAPPELASTALYHGVRLHCTDQEADIAFTRRTHLLAADQAPFLRRMREIKLAALRR